MTNGNAESANLGLPAGTKIGKYEVVEKIGAGGQSVVYKCYDSLLDRYVAAKHVSSHLADNPGFVSRFRREAQVLAKLGGEQQGIVTIHDLLEEEHGLFIVMEYVEGQTLEQMLNSLQGPLATKPAATLLWRLAGAMSAVHTAGIVHRDLKPSNVIVGEDLRPTITDFGVAASLSGQTSMLMGTTKYMAPELFGGGDVDGRADMYSLGFIMYELLLGRERFNEIFADITRDPRISAVRWMKWHGNESVSAPQLHVVNPAIPEKFSSIVAKMTAKDPAHRYADMEELGQAIRQGLAGVALSEQAVVAETLGPQVEAETEIGPSEPEGPTGPTIEQLEEAPTMALPKRSMSKQTRLILIISAAAAIALLGIGVGFLIHLQRSSEASRARRTYAKAMAAYEAGDFTTAKDLFEVVRDTYPDTIRGAMCTVMAPLARAHEALVNEEFNVGFKADYEAEEKLREFERGHGAAMGRWVREREQEIQDLRRQRQQQQDFLQFFSQVQDLAGSNMLREAIDLVERRMPAGLTQQQTEKVEQVIWDLHRRSVIAQWDGLLPRVIEAAIGYRTDQAARYLTEMEQLAGSERAREYMDGRTLQEWQELLRTHRVLVADIAQLAALEDQLGRAREAGDRVAQLNAVRPLLAARLAMADGFAVPPNNAARITDLEADLENLRGSEVDVAFENATDFLNEGLGQLAEGQTINARSNFDKARDKFARCLVLTDGDHAAARDGLSQLDRIERWLERLAAANGLFARGMWDEARSAYRTLSDEHDFAWVQARVTACTFNILVAEGIALMEAGKFAEARDKFDLARNIDRSRYPTDIAPYVARIERLQNRAENIVDGRELLARKEWSDARDAFQQALRFSSTEEEIAEVEDLLTDVEYRKLIETGTRAMNGGQLGGAKSIFLQARDIKETEEVNQLLEEVDQLIAEQQGG